MATAPKSTRISDDKTQDKPQTTAAGDAPADTYDPLETVSSARIDKAAAAAAGYQSVNAVEPTGRIAFPTPVVEGDDRTETYERVGPDGKTYTVTHKIGSGATSAVVKG